MRQDKCGECGDDFVWDADAGSAVCPSCGTLQDSSQVLLDAHIDPEDNANQRDTFSFYHRTTLKSFRGTHGWDLPGQATQAASERNKMSMREFITALSRRIGHSSLSNRTLFLYESAMERGHFRYGRKARLVAGASLATALRENQKGETIKDIAYLLGDSPVALARVLKTVASLLDLKLAPVDTSWHLPALQKHLVDLLAGRLASLPSDLLRVLKSVHFPSAFWIAASLADLASRAGIAVNLPSQATACAIYILALEAETLNSLPQCGELARALGRRFGVSKEVVMRRYRMIYDYALRWADEIPWMNKPEAASGNKSTRKTAKRVVIARCLKDVVQYQEGRWRAKLAAEGPLSSHEDYAKSISSSKLGVANGYDLKQNNEAAIMPRPSKCRKIRATDDVSQFLLSPMPTGSSEKPRNNRRTSLARASHILTSDMLSLKQPPTRLQLLAAVKPADEITDEELFAEGELDSFFRTAEEREALIQMCDWAREKDKDVTIETDTGESRVRRGGKDEVERESASRTPANVESLECLLDGQSLIAWAQNGDDEGDDHDDNWLLSGSARQTITAMTQAGASGFDDEKSETSIEPEESQSLRDVSTGLHGDGEVLGPWRPLSPDSGNE